MIEMLKNPVTVIFGLLAVFFMSMGFGRYMIRRRVRRNEKPKDKPYQIFDPFSEPDEQIPDITAPANPDDKLNEPAAEGSAPKRYFKEFNVSAAPKPNQDADTSGYIWE